MHELAISTLRFRTACLAFAIVGLASAGCSDSSGDAGEDDSQTESDDGATGTADTGESGSDEGTAEGTTEGTTDDADAETLDEGPEDETDVGTEDETDVGTEDEGTEEGETGETGGNPECLEIEDEGECDAHPDCQSVLGSPVKQNGPDSPCLEPQEFIGCIPTQGCGDAISWFCSGNNKQWMVLDTCGPEGAEPCDPPDGDVGDCP